MKLLVSLHHQSYHRLLGHFVMSCITIEFGAGKGRRQSCQKDKTTLYLFLGEVQVC